MFTPTSKSAMGHSPRRRGSLVFVVERHRRGADHYTLSSGEIEKVPLLNSSSRRDT